MSSTREVKAAADQCVCLVILLLSLFAGSGCPAQGASPLRLPSAIAYDTAGNLYIADSNANQVLEATLGGTLIPVAGTGAQGFTGDGGPATAAELNSPQGIAFGPDGSLYIADTGNARIRRVNAAGVIGTFAGTGTVGFNGDGGPATAAVLRTPTALTFDSAGNLLLCDSGNHRLRRISGGSISTVAGSGVQGFSGDGGLAIAAELDTPWGVAVAGDGRIFVADSHNARIRVIGTDGIIHTFAGTGEQGFGGDGGAASAARLSGPRGLAVTASGGLLIADAGNERVREVDSAGVITTIAGSGSEGTSSDGSAELASALRAPRAVAESSFGLAVFADSLNGTVRELAGSVLLQPSALVGGRPASVSVDASTAQNYGQTAATVRVKGAVGVPAGQVQITESGVVLAHAELSGGVCTLQLSSLNPGAHSLIAGYLGDGLNSSATAQAMSVQISSLVLSAYANPASVEYGLPLPQLSGTLSGVLPPDLGQVQAIFSASAGDVPVVGTYPIEVALTGPKSGNYTVDLAPDSGVLRVTQAGSLVSMGDVKQSFVGLPLRLSANVAPSTTGQPTGNVQFFDSGVLVATGTVTGGVASGVYVAPPVGVRSLTAHYSGDSNFLPSSSAAQTASILSMPDFAIGVNGSTVATAAAGGVATYNLTVSAQPGPFTGAVALSASGLPSGATIAFSPPQVVPGTQSAAVTVSVQTAPPEVSFNRRRHGLLGGREAVWASGALLGCFASFKRRSRKLFGLLGITILLTGCGARNVAEGSSQVTSQTYSIHITGTATNLIGSVVTHSTDLTLTVQQ